MIVLAHWTAQPLVLVLGVLLACHEYGRRRLAVSGSDGRPPRESRRQAWLFRAGIAWAAVTLVSPLGYWSHTVLFARAGLVLSFGLLVPPLAVLGAPWSAFGAAAQAVTVRGGRAGPRGRAPIRPAPGSPVLAIAAFLGSLLLWHIPAVLDPSVRSAGLWTAQITCSLAAGVLLWLHIVGSHPFQPGWDPIPRLGLLTTAMSAYFMTGVVLVFSQTAWYPAFAAVPLSKLTDQGLAGAVTWALSMVPLGIAALWCFAEWIGRDEDESRLGQAFQPAGQPRQ